MALESSIHITSNPLYLMMFAHILKGNTVRYVARWGSLKGCPFEVQDVNELPINLNKYDYWVVG
jgi:hypothetical protein